MDENAIKSKGTTIFILGLLSLLMCQLLGPIAFIMGNGYLKECAAWDIEPDGLGKAGRILGLVGTILFVLQFVAVGLYCCLVGGMVGLGGLADM